MEKPKSKQKSALTRDARIILISLAILYSIFTATAFIKTTYFWGINFLYYLPLLQKLLFIGIGGLVFIPYLNDLLYKIYQRIADIFEIIQQRTQKFIPRVIYLLAISIFFAGLFFLFNVVSLYHDTVQGISFIKTNTPIAEYYNNIGNMKNKPLLLFYIVIIRFLFNNLLNFSAYWSLAISSILIGSITIILLDFFLRKLELNPFHQCIVFVLFFTQSITYYYFGYANYYTLVPLVIFLYLYFVIAYFKNSLSLIYPLLLGICAILTHIGTSLIIPSLIFLIILKYRNKMPSLFNLFTFYSMKRSVIVFLLIFILGYLTLSFNLLGFGFLKGGFASLYSGSNEMNLFSIDYLINLLNMLLLHSPIGIVLFLLLLKYLHKLPVSGNVKYFLLWIGIGGLSFNIILYPQGMYAWDGCAWGSVGYVIIGALLYCSLAEQIRYFTYLSTIIITHALMYFCAWIVLNNNVYTCVLHYIDIHPRQIVDCLRMIKFQPIRNLKDKNNLLDELEKRATTKEEYIGLAATFTSLNDSKKALKYCNKALNLFLQAIENNSENVKNYEELLKAFPNSEKYDRINRDMIELLYQNMIRLNPDNPNYLVDYSLYLNAINEYQSALSLLTKADSLLQSDHITQNKLVEPYNNIKNSLAIISFNCKNYLKVIKYYNEALSMGASFKDPAFQSAHLSSINSYAMIGNANKAKILLSIAHQNGIANNINDATIDSYTGKGKSNAFSMIKYFIYSNDYDDLEQLLTFIRDDNDDPEFDLFHSVFYLNKPHIDFLKNNNSKQLLNVKTRTLHMMRCLGENDYLGFLRLIGPSSADSNKFIRSSPELDKLVGGTVYSHAQNFIIQGKYDSVATYGKEIVRCAPDIFQGYFLLGVYYKQINKHTIADTLFDRAIAVVKNSRVVPDPEATKQRIREIKIKR